MTAMMSNEGKRCRILIAKVHPNQELYPNHEQEEELEAKLWSKQITF